MDSPKNFTEGVDTTKLLNYQGGWQVLRTNLDACMHPVDNPNSIESRLNELVGNVQEYDQDVILGRENPQQEIDQLVQNLENAFRLLNKYYKALNKSDLGLTFVVDGYVNVGEGRYQERVNNFPIKEFVFELGKTKSMYDPNFMVSPLDQDGNKFGVSNSYDGFDSDIGLRAKANSGGLTPESLDAIKNVFFQAIRQIEKLRIKLVTIQKQFDYETNIRRVADQNKRLLLCQLEAVGTDPIDSV